MIEVSNTEKKSESMGLVPDKKNTAADLDNSMMQLCKANKSWNNLSVAEDSFLALERQCNMEDKHARLMNANDTFLFDVEPPSDLWNQSVNQSLAIANLDKTQDEDTDEPIEKSPVDYMPHIRPSTIIEETSSQMNSISKSANSSAATTKSSFDETQSIIETVKESKPPRKICDISTEINSSNEEVRILPLCQQNPQAKKSDRQRRGTFAFKRSNYTFFPDENLMPINESVSFVENELNEISNENSCVLHEDSVEDDADKFNNTLERVDYLLEKGKRILEETPVAKKNIHHTSLLETPLFSCKRKRLISEMASEMLPPPKRGPLIDFSTPEPTNQSRFSKFNNN